MLNRGRRDHGAVVPRKIEYLWFGGPLPKTAHVA